MTLEIIPVEELKMGYLSGYLRITNPVLPYSWGRICLSDPASSHSDNGIECARNFAREDDLFFLAPSSPSKNNPDLLGME